MALTVQLEASAGASHHGRDFSLFFLSFVFSSPGQRPMFCPENAKRALIRWLYETKTDASTFHILFLDANHLGSTFPIIPKTSRKRSVRIRAKSLKKLQKGCEI